MVRPKTKEKRGHRTYHGKHKNMRGGGTRGGRGDSGIVRFPSRRMGTMREVYR